MSPTQDGTAGTADTDGVEILEIPHPLVEEDDDDDTPSPRAPSGVRNVRRRLDPSLPAAAIAPNARASLPAAAIAPNAHGTRIQLGGFVSRAGTEIRSPEHAAGLIGILQLARSYPGGIAAALGHNNRTRWIATNINAGVFFGDDGPLQRFLPIGIDTFSRHLNAAQKLARTIFDRDHSNDQSGARGETIPEWARQFFVLFQEQNNQQSRNSRTVGARNERRAVSRSIVGAQAPLGYNDYTNPAELRTETSTNEGTPSMRRQVVGEVNVEREPLMEGRNDTERRRTAPTLSIQNGTRRRNVHLNGSFSPGGNDPASRFQNIQVAYQSLNDLTEAVTQSIAAPLPQPVRTFVSIAREYNEVCGFMQGLSEDDPNHATHRAFYDTLLQRLSDEATQLGMNIDVAE